MVATLFAATFATAVAADAPVRCLTAGDMGHIVALSQDFVDGRGRTHVIFDTEEMAWAAAAAIEDWGHYGHPIVFALQEDGEVKGYIALSQRDECLL